MPGNRYRLLQACSEKRLILPSVPGLFIEDVRDTKGWYLYDY